MPRQIPLPNSDNLDDWFPRGQPEIQHNGQYEYDSDPQPQPQDDGGFSSAKRMGVVVGGSLLRNGSTLADADYLKITSFAGVYVGASP